jgi:hypothetical protein
VFNVYIGCKYKLNIRKNQSFFVFLHINKGMIEVLEASIEGAHWHYF